MSDMTIGEFADRLTAQMAVIMKGFSKYVSADFYKTKLTMPQVMILDLLHKEDELNMSDLARFLNVTTAAVTGLADRLVKSGYVRRYHDESDRRIVHIKLTAKGAGLVKEMHQKRRQAIIDMFGKITQGERDEYLRILNHIREHIGT